MTVVCGVRRQVGDGRVDVMSTAGDRRLPGRLSRASALAGRRVAHVHVTGPDDVPRTRAGSAEPAGVDTVRDGRGPWPPTRSTRDPVAPGEAGP